MINPLNRVREAMHDTLLTRASGAMFDRLCALYGFRRPAIIRQEAWRQSCRSGVFAARGTAGPIFKFLEHAFSQWIEECSTIECLALSVNLLEVPSAFADNSQLENRFCRIGDKLYRSSVLDGRELTFFNVDCPMFSKADFTSLDSYTVKVLPFDIIEQGGLYKVLLDDGILNVPPTYLKEDATDTRGTGEPFGGQLMDFFSAVEGERYGDPLGAGPFPAYLATDDFTDAMGNGFIQMLVAGVRGQIIDFKHSLQDPSLYGSYHQLLSSGTTSAAGPTLITPTRG